MRFVFGLAVGFGIGFAAAILLAPEKKPQPEWLPGSPVDSTETAGLKSFVDSVRRRIDEAVSEAKQAQKEAERDMTERYQRSAGRDSSG